VLACDVGAVSVGLAGSERWHWTCSTPQTLPTQALNPKPRPPTPKSSKPKAFVCVRACARAQAESVARIMVPIINVLAIMVYPVGKLMQVEHKTLNPQP
jgi:hypothetical protein